MAGAELGAILPPDGATFARLGLPREVFFVRPLGFFVFISFMFGAWLGLILLGIHDVSLGFSLRSQFAGQEPISISLHF